ncbi:hypothetical protein [Yersinia phage MHG19]|nr:hypothetical protein [Yersinia phage MHG19]
MLKTHSKYIVNGREMTFVAITAPYGFGEAPVAVFSDENEEIKVTYNYFDGEIYSAAMDRPVIYKNGEWDFK